MGPKLEKPVKKKDKEDDDEDEEEDEPEWAPAAFVSLSGGYDDNASLATFQKPGTKNSTAFTKFRASIGPSLEYGGFKTELVYRFSQSFYWQDHSLDIQGHAAQISWRWESDDFYVKASYSVDFRFFTATDFRQYSTDHAADLDATGHLGGPFWLGGSYAYAFYGVKPMEFQHLRGDQHVVRVAPEIRFADRGKLRLGYELDIANLGIDSTALMGQLRTVLVDVPLSYVGHSGFAYGKWSPTATLDFAAQIAAGRRVYPEISAEFSTRRGNRSLTQLRRDTLVDFTFQTSWDFYDGFSLDLTLFYRISTSNLDGVKFTGSFTNFVATLALTYTH